VSGVVQIFTRTGRDGALRGSVAAQGGTFDSRALDATLAGGIDRLGWSGGVSRFETDGIHTFNNQYRNTSVSGRVRSAPDAVTDLSLSARYRRDSYHFPTDGAGIPSDSNQLTRTRLVTLGAEVGRRITRNVELRVALASADTDAEAEDAPDAPADSVGFGFASRRRADVARRSVDVRMDARAMRHAVISVGGQIERERERQTSSFTSNFGGGAVVEEAPPFDEHRTNRAAYVQGLLDLPAGLAVSAGGRLDDNGKFGTFGTYRLGAAWRLHSGTRLRIATGSAFKAPTFSENFAESPFEVGNPTLEPERVRSWEAGIEQPLLGGRLNLSAAWFDQRFRNLIQYFAAAPGEPTYANLGAARARGIEAAVTVLPAAGLTMSGEYTWLESEVIDAGASTSPGFAAGRTLLRRPAHAGRAAARYMTGRLTAAAGISFVGARDDVDFRDFPSARVTLPAYQLVDLSAELVVRRAAAGAPAVSVTGRIENALDESYEPVVGFRGRGRTILAGARIGI
jgi:vitamin B12 transporter